MEVETQVPRNNSASAKLPALSLTFGKRVVGCPSAAALATDVPLLRLLVKGCLHGHAVRTLRDAWRLSGNPGVIDQWPVGNEVL